MTLRERVKLAEGTGPMVAGRHMAYRDCCGKQPQFCRCEHPGVLTIGYGFNLEDGVHPPWLVVAEGITPVQAGVLLDARLGDATRDARTFLWFASLTPPRQEAIVEVIYQMGVTRFRGFGRAIAALKAGDYEKASLEILDSRWAKKQTPGRARRIAEVIHTGVSE